MAGKLDRGAGWRSSEGLTDLAGGGQRRPYLAASPTVGRFGPEMARRPSQTIREGFLAPLTVGPGRNSLLGGPEIRDLRLDLAIHLPGRTCLVLPPRG